MKMRQNNTYIKEVFYPHITEFPMYKAKNNFSVTKQIAEQVICLPIYTDLAMSDLDKIIHNIRYNKNDQ